MRSKEILTPRLVQQSVSQGYKGGVSIMPVSTGIRAPLGDEPALEGLLGSLRQICATADGKRDDFQFLQNLLQSRDVQALFKTHERVEQQERRPAYPISHNATELLLDVVTDLKNLSNLPEVFELCYLMTRPHIRFLFDAHDHIANKDYVPELPDFSKMMMNDEDSSIKIVRLVKSNEPLGATIKYDDQVGTVVVARIMHGGAADRSGLIHIGDVIYEVNGINVKGKDPDEVVGLLASIDGTITFKLVPAELSRKVLEGQIRVKAHFDFNPLQDTTIPCPEAGLAFRRGEILHIVNQDDPNWWQARKDGDRSMRAGLIPSRQLQERREAVMRPPSRTSSLDVSAVPAFKRSTHSLRISTRSSIRMSKRKIKKVMYHAKQNDEFDPQEIVTYEEVIKVYPDPRKPRPIVLIGPPGVGRNELKRRLVASDPTHFASAIPHTSRTKKWIEEDGKEYHFVSREIMELNINHNRLLEYGEYKGNLYGTSVESVRSVINNGKVCLLTLHPQALKVLKNSDVKPFVIYIKPPPLETLRETRLQSKAKFTMDKHPQRDFSEEELVDMIHYGVRMEMAYKHYFDHVIVNDYLQSAYTEIHKVAEHLEKDPMWVPSAWFR
ncbi:MAGUK p55 subfamily member 7-like isoform X2 [Amphiura filiformis]|uniref:MAGUK p55 subfamily member 7-like isoform X2 n=1 Tax=Amphiura filiformis TaxID=82378 RepID=UPI003B22084D